MMAVTSPIAATDVKFNISKELASRGERLCWAIDFCLLPICYSKDGIADIRACRAAGPPWKKQLIVTTVREGQEAVERQRPPSTCHLILIGNRRRVNRADTPNASHIYIYTIFFCLYASRQERFSL
jgi:hypothetical protein